MNSYSLVEVFTLIFVTMGPIKPLVTFAEKTASLDSAVRGRIGLLFSDAAPDERC